MSDHEEFETAVAAWVLGALDPEEASTVQAHVEGCSSCAETAARLRRAVGAMPLAVDEVSPPARLRERILAAAAASRTSTPAPSRVRAKVPPPRRQGRGLLVRLTERVPAYALAAGVAVALLAGALIGDLLARGAAGPPAQAQVARFTFSGHDALSGARAMVIDLKSDGVALVDFSGLPAVQPGRVYEVWLITPSGRADAAAVFVPDNDGGKIVLVNRSLAGYSEMAITNEQGPEGSEAPTQQPQMSGKLA